MRSQSGPDCTSEKIDYRRQVGKSQWEGKIGTWVSQKYVSILDEEGFISGVLQTGQWPASVLGPQASRLP